MLTLASTQLPTLRKMLNDFFINIFQTKYFYYGNILIHCSDKIFYSLNNFLKSLNEDSLYQRNIFIVAMKKYIIMMKSGLLDETFLSVKLQIS